MNRIKTVIVITNRNRENEKWWNSGGNSLVGEFLGFAIEQTTNTFRLRIKDAYKLEDRAASLPSWDDCIADENEPILFAE